MQLLVPVLDYAVVGKLAEHTLERGAVGVLEAESARDLARADLTGLFADKRDELVLGRQLRASVAGDFGQGDIGSGEFAP